MGIIENAASKKRKKRNLKTGLLLAALEPLAARVDGVLDDREDVAVRLVLDEPRRRRGGEVCRRAFCL